VIARTIAAATHGRYLVVPPEAGVPAPWPLLVGFHGYAEAAEAQLERMRAVPRAAGWLIVSVQALHRFYRGRSDEVVGGWMTRQDRELAIADNIAYVDAVVGEIAREWSVSRTIVFSGFSQGVAMAFRAAAAGAHAPAGVIACGGDVPPELDASALRRVPAALVGRGVRDEWYTAAKLFSDTGRLRGAGVDLTAVEFDGGHDWSSSFADAAGDFLSQRS
jgi:predicted esterase